MTCGSDSEYLADIDALRTQDPELAAEVASFQSLETVLAWLEKRGLIPGNIDLIAQDEFEYDFLIQLKPSERWLVFGVT